MLKHIKIAIATIVTASATLFLAINAPQLHNSYLRYEVGQSVVQVLRPDEKGGGTGFAVKAASGKEFIATNKHVCDAAINGWMKVSQQDGITAFKRVVYKDNIHDLCLIEGDSRLDSLDIGSIPKKGEIIHIVGHPGLRQLTVSSGEFIGRDTVHLIDNVKSRAQCKGEVIEAPPIMQILLGIEFICVRSYPSFATTAVAYPGNSGSPVVNKYGNVIGVLFAGSTQQERDNHIVPIQDLARVLNKF